MNDITIAQCLQLAPQLEAVSESARLDIELILCHLLQKNRTWLFTWPETRLTAEQADLFQRYFARRKTGEPVAHIVGQREFWSLPLAVNPSTLIPRPDTEVLVETALELFAADAPQQSRRCLDLGTGTGAIALALASEKPQWFILGVDVSAEAVALAEQNRQTLGFEQVSLMQSNWFESIPAQAFDLIVSNPPYIDPQDPHLAQGDVRFEPLSALIAERQGLADLETIVAGAGAYLAPRGWLLVEHGYDQASAVHALFVAQGFKQVETRRDYGGNDRVTLGCRSVDN